MRENNPRNYFKYIYVYILQDDTRSLQYQVIYLKLQVIHDYFIREGSALTFWRRIFFQILAHSVFKM